MEPATQPRPAESGGTLLGQRPPRGTRVRLASHEGRGRSLFVREVPGPPGAPVLLLLHGWVASGGLNWFRVFEPLGRHFRVLAVDLRGHARGIRSWRFRLADCADDCAALLDALGVERAIAVGYSMGGAVAQLLWLRHRERVAGLVLCATGPVLVPHPRQRELLAAWLATLGPLTRFSGLTDVASLVPGDWLARRTPRWLAPLAALPRSLGPWAALEMGRHDLRMLVQAGRDVLRHDATGWIHTVDVPTAVVATTRDRGVDGRLQLLMADRIPSASLFRIDDGHLSCARAGFATPLLAACGDVAERLS